MFRQKEIIWIVVFSVILGILIELKTDINSLLAAIPWGIISVFIVIIINIVAKKLTARYLDSSVEIGPWKIERYGFSSSSVFKKPFPAGIIFPIVSAIVSFGYFIWLAVLEFEPSPLSSRVSKRHGLYRYSELTEFHIAVIAASGLVVNLLFSIILYLFNFTELGKLSIFFACWSLVPIGNFDGSKILFGSRILWMSLVLIAIIFLAYALLLI